MSIKIKITKGSCKDMEDTNKVVKVVLVNENNEVLLLTRSKNLLKFAGDLDLPGGHIKENESEIKGLKREVKEETDLDISNPQYHSSIDNISFFWEKYNSQPVKISDEHSDYGFYSSKKLNKGEKFQKIALEVLKKYFND